MTLSEAIQTLVDQMNAENPDLSLVRQADTVICQFFPPRHGSTVEDLTQAFDRNRRKPSRDR